MLIYSRMSLSILLNMICCPSFCYFRGPFCHFHGPCGLGGTCRNVPQQYAIGGDVHCRSCTMGGQLPRVPILSHSGRKQSKSGRSMERFASLLPPQVCVLWFTHKLLPETKGRTLEEIEGVWSERYGKMEE